MPSMLIVAIGWLYVVLMMALTQPTVTAGLATFIFYGILPLGVTLYLLDTPGRRRRARAQSLSDDATRAGSAANSPGKGDTSS